MTRVVTRAWTRDTQRGRQMKHGRVPSDWIVEFDGDRVRRRVYEDWTRFVKSREVPLVVMIRDEKISVTRAQIRAGMRREERAWTKWAAELHARYREDA